MRDTYPSVIMLHTLTFRDYEDHYDQANAGVIESFFLMNP